MENPNINQEKNRQILIDHYGCPKDDLKILKDDNHRCAECGTSCVVLGKDDNHCEFLKRIPGTIYFRTVAELNDDGQLIEGGDALDSVAYVEKDGDFEVVGEFRPFGEVGPNLSRRKYNYWMN